MPAAPRPQVRAPISLSICGSSSAWLPPGWPRGHLQRPRTQPGPRLTPASPCSPPSSGELKGGRHCRTPIFVPNFQPGVPISAPDPSPRCALRPDSTPLTQTGSLGHKHKRLERDQGGQGLLEPRVVNSNVQEGHAGHFKGPGPI